MASNAVRTLLLGLGLVSIGAAMGWAVALALLQDAAIAAGEFPEPGARVSVSLYKTSPFWDAATTLQQLANVAGVAGAVLLLGFGWLSRDEVSDS